MCATALEAAQMASRNPTDVNPHQPSAHELHSAVHFDSTYLFFALKYFSVELWDALSP